MKHIRDKAWASLSKHLDGSYEEFVYMKFEECFDYSPVNTWNKVIADIIVIMKKREEQKEYRQFRKDLLDKKELLFLLIYTLL